MTKAKETMEHILKFCHSGVKSVGTSGSLAQTWKNEFTGKKMAQKLKNFMAGSALTFAFLGGLYHANTNPQSPEQSPKIDIENYEAMEAQEKEWKKEHPLFDENSEEYKKEMQKAWEEDNMIPAGETAYSHTMKQRGRSL